jgi:hypothetical protein
MVRIFLNSGICCPHAANELRDQASIFDTLGALDAT